jgi:nicotinamide-nucleotide amidase
VLEKASVEMAALLEPHVYGTGGEKLPAVLGRELLGRGLKVVTAESCTGGLAAKLLTDTPGSSSWMDRGFVVYSNGAKEEVLGVPAGLLNEHGAVSEPVARAMLQGALERSRAEVGVAITGVAGPDGGTAEKPVGTVWIAWGGKRNQEANVYRFPWDREYNRILGAWAAMHRLLQYVRRS